MRAGRIFIHGCFPHHTLLRSIEHQLLNLRDALDNAARQILNVDALVRVFLELKPLVLRRPITATVPDKEISDVFVIDLEIGAANKELHLVLVRAFVNEAEDVIERVGYDASMLGTLVLEPHHGVSLAAACLPVCENRAVISFKNALHEGKGTFIVDRPLRGCPIVHSVIGEGFLVARSFLDDNLVELFVNLNAAFSAFVYLALVDGSRSDHDLDAFAHF